MATKKILCQFDVQAVTSLSNPGAGYVGFSAKADGLYQKIAATADVRLLTASDAVNYQPVDADLTAIAGVGGDVGFLKKTDVNTWTLDTSIYALSTHTHAGAYAALAGSLTQAFNAASLTIEAGTYDWYISGSGGVLTFANSAPSAADISFVGGRITTKGAMANTIAHFDEYSTIAELDTVTYPSLTELSYLKGITGAINTTYAQVAGSLTQAFNASQLTIEGGYYDWIITQASGNLNIYQYTTSFQFHSSGITYSPATANTLAYFDGTKILKTLPTASYPNLTEIGYVKGVTGAINTTYAKIAGSTTQTFSTANLSVTGAITITSTAAGKLAADGTNMTINGGKINLSAIADPTHYLYNNAQDWEAIHTNNGFMVENYNGGVNPNYTGGVSTWASFSVTAAGAVWTNGNISAQEVYRRSSRELKYEIQHFTGSAMSIINNIKIMSYRMKSDYSFSIGFIAEDTHPFLSGEDRKGHIFGNHLAILTKAIQEEDQKILQLQRQVTELQNQIKQLQDGRRL